MTATLSSPPRYLTPRQAANPQSKRLSVNTSPPTLYSTSVSNSGSFSSESLSFGGGSPTRNMVNVKSNTNLRSKNKHHQAYAWILMLLFMSAVNVCYQKWYSNKVDGASDFGKGALWSITGLPHSVNVAGNGDLRQPLQLHFDLSNPLMDQLASTQKPAFLYAKPSSKETTAVFYHVFLPPGEEGRENSRRIITEQLQQLASSDHPDYILYYNTIGEMTNELNHTHIQKLCLDRSITCHHMDHYQEGMEDKTLQRLHDFCSVDDDSSDHAVVYLHNKGSFSRKPLNEAWRYQMTQSVVSPDCQKHTTNADGECNLCGLYFTAERGLFMAGNMWRTRCSYVKHLIAPSQFQEAMHIVTGQAMLERLRNRFAMTLQELRSGVFGIDRYATEFWIASHPQVRPCDFSKVIEAPDMYDMTEIFLRWLRQKVYDEDYHSNLESAWFAESAPYHPLPLTKNLKVSKYKDVRLREYFLMAGNLFRWYGLYGQAPPVSPSAWAYQWFPDGEQWKKAVQEHGSKSVAVVTDLAAQMEVDTARNKYTRDNTNRKVVVGSNNRNRRHGIKANKNGGGAKKGTTLAKAATN